MSKNQYSDSDNSNKAKTENLRRYILFHATTPNEAEQIILKQNFNNINYPGIQFDFTLEGAQLDHYDYGMTGKNNKPTILVADVYIGECIIKTRNEIFDSKINIDKLKKKRL